MSSSQLNGWHQHKGCTPPACVSLKVSQSDSQNCTGSASDKIIAWHGCFGLVSSWQDTRNNKPKINIKYRIFQILASLVNALLIISYRVSSLPVSDDPAP